MSEPTFQELLGLVEQIQREALRDAGHIYIHPDVMAHITYWGGMPWWHPRKLWAQAQYHMWYRWRTRR